MKFEDFKKEVEASGLQARRCTEVHWQIRGGIYCVNVYPTTNRVYVNQTKEARNARPDNLVHVGIRAAITRPNFARSPEDRPSHGFVKRMKARLWNEGKRKCCWCDKPFHSLLNTTLEHVVPLARGGSARDYGNLALACPECNAKHADGNFLKDRSRDEQLDRGIQGQIDFDSSP